jgi:hypothetical protein
VEGHPQSFSASLIFSREAKGILLEVGGSDPGAINFTKSSKHKYKCSFRIPKHWGLAEHIKACEVDCRAEGNRIAVILPDVFFKDNIIPMKEARDG